MKREKGDENFGDLLVNKGDYRIFSVLRKSDNVVLNVDDETDFNWYSNGDRPYYETIGGFVLDGEYYMNYELKSETGIQVAFGGGTFKDIKDINLRKNENR